MRFGLADAEFAMIDSEPLFNAMSIGVLISEPDGTILYMNPSAANMLDLARVRPKSLNSCQLLCNRLFEAGSESCAAHCALLDPASRERTVGFLGRHGPRSSVLWKDHQFKRMERWAHLRVRCLKVKSRLWGLADKERHVTLIEDASAEIELARLKEEWRQMVAHDLRSPLTSVYATLRLLQDAARTRPLKAEEADLIDSSVGACRRMAEMVDLFLDLARLQSGEMRVQLGRLSLRPIVAKIVGEKAAHAASRRVVVEVSVADDAVVRGDEKLLERVIQNLLDNAVKFARDGGRVEIKSSSSEGRVILSVKDDGPGIAEEHLPHLFDPLRQAQALRNTKLRGYGLGLAFCRSALKAMGGDIDARSNAGGGGEFIVTLSSASTVARNPP